MNRKLLLVSGSPIAESSTTILLLAAASGYSEAASAHDSASHQLAFWHELPLALLAAKPAAVEHDWHWKSPGFIARQILLTSSHQLTIEFAFLNRMQILPCQSCGAAPTPDWCFFHDDLTPVLASVADCDALIIGSPIHFDAVSAQTKLFVDRCNCFRPPDWSGQLHGAYQFVKLLPRKRPGGMILVGGPDAWFEGARRCLAGLFKWIEVQGVGQVQFQSHDYQQSGHALTAPASLHEAKQLGERLFAAHALRSDSL